MGFLNWKIILFLSCLASFIHAGEAIGQCDLEIYDFHPETLETTIIVHNGFGCNPNDPTDDVISKFILGITSNELQADNVECGLAASTAGWILQNYIIDFPLWDEENAYLGPDGILSTGDTLTFNLFDAQLGEAYAETCYNQALDLGYFDDCIEVMIWQINCSNDIYGFNAGEDSCADNEDNGYDYPDVNPLDNIFDVFCATDLTFGENEFGFGCNNWDPEQWPGYNNNTWYWNFTNLDIFNQGFSTAHQYTVSTYYNDQLAWSIAYNSDFIDWISIPPDGNQYFSNVPTDPSETIGDDPLEEIKIVISDVFPAESDTTNNTLILTNLVDFVWLENCIIEGCTDPEANNFNPNANTDDGSCTYDIIDLNLFYAQLNFNCDSTNNEWSFTQSIKFTNNGNVPVDEWCVQAWIDGDQVNPFHDQCYNITVLPGEEYELFIPDIIVPLDLGYSLPILSVDYLIYGVVDEDELLNNNITVFEDLIQYFGCLPTGCTDQLACNYDPDAVLGEPEDECNYPDECGECDGENTGPGAIYECGCDPLPFEDACDCEGNSPIDLFQCDCEGTPDLDQDGICDEEDDCVGFIDECGVCNGPGAIYDCGCFDIPEGDCDCLGNVLDACGICGGTGTDIDGDGICDDEDPCIGVLDICGVCNGDGTSCFGCTDSNADNYDPYVWFDDGSCAYCSQLWIPNTFTPNNDGVNDVWHPVTDASCWREWDLRIYNRWGSLVWYSDDPESVWLGQADDSFYYVSDGVYVYHLEAVSYDLNVVEQLRGHITIFR